MDQKPSLVDEIKEVVNSTGNFSFAYPYVLGMIRAILKFNGPAEKCVAEINNVIAAFDQVQKECEKRR